MSIVKVFRNAKLSKCLNGWGPALFHRRQCHHLSQPHSLKPLPERSLDTLDRQARVKHIFSRVQGSRYPIKLLRYWFMYNLLQAESEHLGRPLRICEIGVDRGQMRLFAQDAGFWQKRLRKNARPFHHVSVFSPERTIKMAALNGMKIDFMSGAFLLRRTGFFS